MEITDIKIKNLDVANTEGKFKAVASITIDNCFVVHDIKIIEGTEDYFIAMPSRKTKQGEHRDIAHPINTDTRRYIQNKVVAEYKRIKDQPQTEN